MISNSDKTRIEQAAKEYAKRLYSSDKSKPYVTTHGDQEVCCVTDFKAGCDYMEPILSQKQAELKEWEEKWRKGTEINQELSGENEGYRDLLKEKDEQIKELVKALARVSRCCEDAGLQDRIIVDIHSGVMRVLTKHKKQ